MNIFIVIFIIVIIIIYIYLPISIENFKPYNVFKVDDTFITKFKSDSPTILEEHETIINIINSKNSLVDFKNVIFENLPHYQSLIHENQFKEFIISFLYSLNFYDRLNKKISFSIPLRFTDVKYAKGCDSLYYLFKCEIINNTFNVPKTFNVCIKKKNDALSLIYIKSEINDTVLSVKGIDDDMVKKGEKLDSLFRTKNSLFLFDPFKTSSSDSQSN